MHCNMLKETLASGGAEASCVIVQGCVGRICPWRGVKSPLLHEGLPSVGTQSLALALL